MIQVCAKIKLTTTVVIKGGTKQRLVASGRIKNRGGYKII
jgi:hypothetical protein